MKIPVCCGVKGTEMSIEDDGKGDVLFTITFVAPVKAGEFIDFVVEKKALQKFLRTIQKEPKKKAPKKFEPDLETRGWINVIRGNKNGEN